MIRDLLGLVAIAAAGVDFDVYQATMAPEVDYGRTCLALVGFSEARDQSAAGLAAVMHVVVARATDPAQRWPRTLCAVALEPGQFIGLERWHVPRRPERIDLEAWTRALDMADQVIAGNAPVPDACLSATAFDQGPAGARSICQIGPHFFYRSTP